MRTNWKLGLGLSLVTALSWGLLPLALKVVLENMDPITISWFRFSVAALIGLLWFGAGLWEQLKQMLSVRFLPLCLTVVVGLIGNYLLYLFGLDYINPGAVGILIQVAPLLLLGGSVIIFREAFSFRQWLGVLCLCIGLLLFFHLRLNKLVFTSDNYVVGVGLILGAAILWSLSGLAQKQLLKDFHAKDILLIICLGGSLALLPVSKPLQVIELSMTELGLLLFCGLNTIVAYGCFGLAMSHWQASRVSAVITIAPLLTLLFTALVNSLYAGAVAAEPMDWLSYLGAILVVAGAAVTALSGKN